MEMRGKAHKVAGGECKVAGVQAKHRNQAFPNITRGRELNSNNMWMKK